MPVPGHQWDLPTAQISLNLTSAVSIAASSDTSGLFNAEVAKAVSTALPILLGTEIELGLPDILDIGKAKGRGGRWSALMTSFMDIHWQNDHPANPADAAIGPQGYDNHLYYNYGGVADPNPNAYMASICNLTRVQDDAALGNSPLWLGEWAMTTNFDATDEFLKDWGDAQKLAYSKGAGWIWWNFRVEQSELAGDLGRQWSYLEAVEHGFMTKDPSKVFDPNVCEKYLASTASTSPGTSNAGSSARPAISVSSVSSASSVSVGTSKTSSARPTATSESESKARQMRPREHRLKYPRDD